MESWRCVRDCFFRSKLYQPGEIVTGEEIQIPRHFVSLEDGRPGGYPKRDQKETKKEESIDEVMGDSPALNTAKTMMQMTKLELINYARGIGLELTDDIPRPQMIKLCIERKQKLGMTSQDIANSSIKR